MSAAAAGGAVPDADTGSDGSAVKSAPSLRGGRSPTWQSPWAERKTIGRLLRRKKMLLAMTRKNEKRRLDQASSFLLLLAFNYRGKCYFNFDSSLSYLACDPIQIQVIESFSNNPNARQPRPIRTE
jgi:hypothetical protein